MLLPPLPKNVVAVAVALLPSVLLALAPRPARAEDTLMPSIVHEACAEYLKGKPFEIVARFEDQSQLFDPKVMYRAAGDSHWKHAAFVRDASGMSFRATIKSKDLKGTFEYFIEVFDEFGNGPARMGSPEAPIRVQPSKAPEACEQVPAAAEPMAVTAGSTPAGGAVSPGPGGSGPVQTPAASGSSASAKDALKAPVPPPPSGACDQADRPLYCEAWLWGTLGALVAVGGGVALWLVLSPKDQTPPRRDSVTLQVTGPDPIGVAP
ncbi:MAG: hypothetical protein HY903_08860 [Deltaproteobacteria bacterium]|nr:hypothetical protein [Deltaproteobacteria bacterium]